MKIKVALLLFLSILCFTSLTAQKKPKNIILEGTVVNAAREPIANAIIMIDDQKTNSLTDAQGNFKVKVSPAAVKIGIFTFGHGTYEDSIKGRTRIDITFSATRAQQASDENVAPGEEGVNTGYGLVKKKNLTTDVTKIDGSNKKYRNYSSIKEMIEREASGVRLINGVFVIQGSQDFFGDTPALIVVDGVPMNSLPEIPPISVLSIEVLKGTSAAIYGSRGYGGAILIKTKTKLE
jgi:TonB-dependent starch-binding outer membrane protein SusC